MRNFKWILLISIFILTFGCSKDPGSDLLEDSIDYKGTLPELSEVTFDDNGKTVSLHAFKNRFHIYFIAGTSSTKAIELIKSKSGNVLAQIPNMGYYYVECTNISITPKIFMASFQSMKEVTFIAPSMPLYPKAGSVILDYCYNLHGWLVEASLKACHGSSKSCKDIAKFKGDTIYASDQRIFEGIKNEIAANGNNPTLINLSFNGGLPNSNEYDYEKLNSLEQHQYKEYWLWTMKIYLMNIAAFSDAQRSNLIITIAAGNENCPIGPFLAELRNSSPRIAKVLKENVVLVSTNLMKGIKANHAIDDPDVIVINDPNSFAGGGTSFATPCALGYIESIIAKGLNAKQAIDLIKLTSRFNSNREVKHDSLLKNIDYTMNYDTYSGDTKIVMNNIISSEFGGSTCVVTTDYFFEPTIYWKNKIGYLVIPTQYNRVLTSGPCILKDKTNEKNIYNIALSGDNNNIVGNGFVKYFRDEADCGSLFWYFPLTFNGKVDANGNITGVLKMTVGVMCGGQIVEGPVLSKSIVLTKR